jgi:hypothetical protein
MKFQTTKFQVGDRVTGTTKLYEHWGTHNQLPRRAVGTVFDVSENSISPTYSVKWKEGRGYTGSWNTYHDHDLQMYIADKLDLI